MYDTFLDSLGIETENKIFFINVDSHQDDLDDLEFSRMAESQKSHYSRTPQVHNRGKIIFCHKIDPPKGDLLIPKPFSKFQKSQF